MTSDTLKTITPESIFLDELRNATATAHKNLEYLPVSSVVLKPSVTIDEYAHYLNVMLAVVSSLETYVFPILADAIPETSNEKSTWIKSDIVHIGREVNKVEHNIFESDNPSIGFALGIAYVVEGSALGGRFIFKNIEAALGFTDEHGARYFAGYGNKTGSHWKGFLNAFTSYIIENDAQDDAIAGANFAFSRIHEHFENHSR